MKQILFIMIPVTFFALLLVGGLGPRKTGLSIVPDTNFYTLSDSGERSEEKTLQMKALLPNASNCANKGKIAVNLLLDNSGSMNAKNGNRIAKLREAVIAFAANLSDEDVIGAQKFNTEPGNLIDINTWAKNKATFNGVISKLGARGGTHTKAALTFSMTKVTPAKPVYPDHKWVLIVVSDGIPNPYPAEDPRKIAADIKSQIQIITVGIDLDEVIKDKELAKDVLRETASTPADFYNTSTDNVVDVFKKISTSLGCSAPAAPTKPACVAKRPAINLLIDTSNSLEAELPALKVAMLNFVRKLSDTDSIAVEEFGHGNASGSLILPLTNYGLNKALVESKINGLKVDESGDSYTRMKDGFVFAKDTIDSSTLKNYNEWVFLLFSDGHPKTATADPDPAQDPSAIATDLKNNGMRIITIGLGTDVTKGLMTNIASANDAHFANAAGDLDKVFQDITTTTSCQ